jgi:putative transposase
VDICSRAIVGWPAATHKRAKLVLDALQMALWRRDRDRASHRAVLGASQRCRVAQYTSFRFTAHLIESGIDASIGTVGDAYDNALMESATGLYKTELINKQGPWKSLADIELATAGYIEWFNNRRLHSAIGHIPPAEHEASYYAQTEPRLPAGAAN